MLDDGSLPDPKQVSEPPVYADSWQSANREPEIDVLSLRPPSFTEAFTPERRATKPGANPQKSPLSSASRREEADVYLCVFSWLTSKETLSPRLRAYQILSDAKGGNASPLRKIKVGWPGSNRAS